MLKRGPAFAPLLLFIPMFVFLPVKASAQVVINEVMYNPQGSDTGREWVELYNEGQSDITMVGGSGKGSWRINDGSNHTLTDPASGTGRGSLTVPAGGYLVIANDPTDFVSGENAGGTYSAIKSSLALNNNGATITLLDGTGATIDTVTYMPSQGGDDDGTSLQRQADGSWITALPTPGAANAATPYTPPPPVTDPTSQTSDASDSSSTSNATASQSSYVPPPTPSLYADAGEDRTVIVGADVEFDASAYDKTQTLLDPSTVRFMWNFGDGTTMEGPAVLHHFSYPGRYAVQLEIADNRNAAPAQFIVTAEPAQLSFSLLSDGGVQIEDDAGHDLDLSGWIVRKDAGQFSSQFILPSQSKVLDGSSINISSQTLSFLAASSSLLEYPNGAFAFVVGQSATTTQTSSITVQAPPIDATAIPKLLSKSSEAPIVDADEDADVTDTDSGAGIDDASSSEEIATSTVLQTAAVDNVSFSNYLWWVGIGTFALAAAAALTAASYFKKGEWDIIEDNAE